MDFSDDAREILVVAQELARLRNAGELTARDVALAAIFYRHLQADRRIEPVQEPSLSPEMLPMASSVQRVLENSAGMAELEALAVSENPDLAEYLG